MNIPLQEIKALKQIKTLGALLKWYKRTIRSTPPNTNRAYRGETTIVTSDWYIKFDYSLTTTTRVTMYDKQNDKTYRTNQRITNHGRDKWVSYMDSLGVA
jgi:hypothetical protein